jgi:ATP-dependent helicase/nuclease subunit A
MTDVQETKKRKLDQDQIDVKNADSNVVVSAGAGSGKTTVLAERYVRLVCERNISVDEILTLTFTRKAAAEMYSRIYQRLSETNHPKAAEQLKRFDQARISTLDSFCTLICRGASYRYGIAGNFRMDEVELAKIAADTAIDIIMKHRDESVIQNLVSSRTFDEVAQNIFADIGIKYISIVDNDDFEKLAEKQIQFLESEINHLWKSIEELCNEIIQIDNVKNNATVEKAKEAVKQFPEFQLMNDEILKILSDSSGFLRSGKSFSKPKSNVKDAALVELRDYALPLKEQSEKLESVLESYSFKEDILSLGRIINEYAKSFQEQKRKKGILSFSDAAELAVMILRDDHELRNYYKKQFKIIMIDEFQDNNRLQKELLYLLAEREDICCSDIPSAEDLTADKLFFVGDEKQSIYRFRGADVSVFRGLSAELKKTAQEESQKNPVSMELKTNYRSHPELVRFFNDFFLEVFAQAKHLYEAEYNSMIPRESKNEDTAPRVEIYLQEKFSLSVYDDEENDDAEESVNAALSEALHVAARIVEGVKAKEFSFGDVAILFRSTVHQNYFEKCFRDVGIPFNAADPRGIFSEALVNDFYAMLRLVLFHQDTNAYATVLRSPFTKIGDETFIHIMLDYKDEPFPENPPEHWFQNESDKVRYDQARLIFCQLEKKIDIEDISDVVSFLWYETSYRIGLIDNQDTIPLLEHFNYLYELALDASKRKLNMTSFLDELAPLIGTYEKTAGGDPEIGEDAVTMMTVHKSKGLEFKVLIIADAGSESKMKTGTYYMSNEFGPVVNMKSVDTNRDKSASNYIYEISKDENKLQSEAELKRLFYVAATRAEERLLIFGTRKLNKDLSEEMSDLEDEERLGVLLRLPRTVSSKNTECKDSFMDLLYIAADRMYQKNIIPNWKTKSIPLLGMSEERNKIAELKAMIRLLQSKNQSYQNAMSLFYNMPSRKYEVSKKRIINPSTLEVSEVLDAWGKSLPLFSCDKYLVNDDLKKAFGTLCHFVIEKLFHDEEAESIPHNVMDIFKKENLKPGEIKNILSAALECGKSFLSSERGNDALSARRSETEYPFYLPFNRDECEAIMVKGTIDLIFETEEECIVIDFKTDQYMKPEIHQVQMDTYRLAAKAFSDLPVKIFLVYLRSMEAVEMKAVLTKEKLFDAMVENLAVSEIEQGALND